MKKTIEKILASFARKTIKKYKPLVIAITGSVGKTTTRKTVASVLDEAKRVRTAREKDYNNELGIPLVILGEETQGRSIFGWLGVLWRGFRVSMGSDKNYPEILVLEYGIDHPGDMIYLCDIAEPDISVLTMISPVHVEHFGSLENLIAEKATILARTKESGHCFLNVDDDRVLESASKAKGEVHTYGMDERAQVRGSDIQLSTEPIGTSFMLHSEGVKYDIHLAHLLGKAPVSSALCAIAIAQHLGLSIDQIAAGLSKLIPTQGRMNVLAGIKGTTILDDSYNAAPASVIAAIDTLREFELKADGRRIAVLGKMAELGNYVRAEHESVGKHVSEKGIDLLVCVGQEATSIRDGALAAGMNEEDIMLVSDSIEAGRWLDREIDTDDIILVKGSQSARMEKTVKDIMADPLSARQLLARQYGAWLED